MITFSLKDKTSSPSIISRALPLRQCQPTNVHPQRASFAFFLILLGTSIRFLRNLCVQPLLHQRGRPESNYFHYDCTCFSKKQTTTTKKTNSSAVASSFCCFSSGCVWRFAACPYFSSILCYFQLTFSPLSVFLPEPLEYLTVNDLRNTPGHADLPPPPAHTPHPTPPYLTPALNAASK